MSQLNTHPRLRPVEARPSPNRNGAVDLVDRSGISPHVMSLSGPALFIASKMDGAHSRADIQAAFIMRHGRMLFSSELDAFIQQLDEAMFLAGPRFDAHMEQLTRTYREAKFRPLRDAESLGAPKGRLGKFLDEILKNQSMATEKKSSPGTDRRRLTGFIAPHLDYSRGAPCYATAYRQVAASCDAKRFIILGTNHFGRSTSVVGTSQPFETHGSVVPCDVPFMQRMNKLCGVDLCEFEFDHAREHSIELQAVLLRHVLPDREFSIASYLCPDPCGPSGTKPVDGRGVDLKAFALALRDAITADDMPTCVIASADLSHVGRYFQDDHDLNTEYLSAIAESDKRALSYVSASDPEGFRQCVAATNNRTSICSVGCIYVLATACRETATPELLHYHQALMADVQNCVSSAAAVYYAV